MGSKVQLQINNTELQKHLDEINLLPNISDLKKGAYVWKKLDKKDGKFISFVPDNDPNKYPDGEIGYDGFYYELYGDSTLRIVTWADGTDEEIVAMVQAADRGEINLADYWTVGQQRKVTLSAMPKDEMGNSFSEQVVTLVLMNKGGRNLAVPTESGRNVCSFVVGMKDCLKENGRVTKLGSTSGGWSTCNRRNWCNTIFRDSIPSSLIPIFKEFKNKATKGNLDSSMNTVIDLFSLPAEYEVAASTTHSGANEGSQFQWYKTHSNRVKRKGDGNFTAIQYYLRSPSIITNAGWTVIQGDGLNSFVNGLTNANGISPFGCI